MLSTKIAVSSMVTGLRGCIFAQARYTISELHMSGRILHSQTFSQTEVSVVE